VVASMVAVPVALSGTLLAVVSGPCDTETTYYCAIVQDDPDRPGGRTLVLDTLRHSYVDVADPAHLEFRYTRLFADVVASLPDGPLTTLSIGGGALTLPRYVSAVRPGSAHTVLEIDGALVDLVRSEIGIDDVEGDLTMRVGDARVLLTDEPAGRYDIVFGDAFGGLSVPWHLTTEEFTGDVARVLSPGGVYVLNLIDFPPLHFARAEAATVAAVFDHVVLLAPPDYVAGGSGGNFVLVASDEPIDATALADRIRARDGAEIAVAGSALEEFAADATILTDEYAPVDQLLGRP